MSDKLVKIAKDVNNARAETEDLAEDLKKLTKQGGLLDALQKQLYLLVQQSKNWVKKEDVQL